MDIWYLTMKWIARLYSVLFIDDLRVCGHERVPMGPKIFAANHPYTNNALLLPLIFPDRQYFLVSAGAFDFPVWGWYLKLSGQIPVAAGKGRQALKKAAEILAKGDSIVILPEGRTTRVGCKRKAGTGVIRLALNANAPIIPVGFYTPETVIKTIGLSSNKEADGYFQVGGPCFIEVGEPWFPACAGAGEKINGVSIRSLTDQLMDRIRALTAQAEKRRFA